MHRPGTPTAVVTMGANPGLASAFLKSALRSMAEDNEVDIPKSGGQDDWAGLARDLDIRAIHVSFLQPALRYPSPTKMKSIIWSSVGPGLLTHWAII